MLYIVLLAVLMTCGLGSDNLGSQGSRGADIFDQFDLSGSLELTQTGTDSGGGQGESDNPCAHVQCMNGGTCVHTGEDQFRCDCPRRVSGRFCHIKAIEPTMGYMTYDEHDEATAAVQETKLSIFDSYMLRVLHMQDKQIKNNKHKIEELKAKAENDTRKIEALERDIQHLQSATPVSAQRSPLIVGGQDTPISNFPWQIALLYNGNFICGGTIVSQRWIITAAHCVSGRNRRLLEVIVGSSSIKPWGYLPKDRISINGYLMHRSYTGRATQWQHDLALIQLSRALTLDAVNGNKRSIPLADSGDDFTGSTCTITGYGRIEGINGPLPTLLQAADVPVVSNTECERVLKSNNLITGEVVIHNEQMCAGAVEGGKGICAGDSGSPLSCERPDGSHVLAGIVSSGFGCARVATFGVFTRMSVYKAAIQAVLRYYGP